MKHYYVNKNSQSNGDHEVHTDTCSRLPDVTNRVYLGLFLSCKDAVEKAKKENFKKANGCYYCSLACHTS